MNGDAQLVKDDIEAKVAKISANMPSGYFVKGDVILKETHKDKTPSMERICDFMAVENISRDSETQELVLTLIYKSGADGFLEKKVPASLLNSRSIEELSNFGLDISSQNKILVNAYLIASRKVLKSEIHFREYGWIEIDGQRVFAADRVITPSGEFSNAKLDGDIDLSPKGHHYKLNDKDLPIYHDMLNNENLQLALALGLSAAILPVIRTKYTDLNAMIYSLTGFSSSGKTSAAKLALSVAGRPSGKNSLFGTWSSTLNAVSARLNGNFGVPILFDEVSEYRGNDLTSIVYNISDGKQKSRLMKNGQQQPQKFWCTAVLSTGESPLLGMTTGNEGLYNRCLEFSNVEWTSSAEQSDRVKFFAEKNNGYWTDDLITSIYKDQNLDVGDNKILDIFDDMKKRAEKIIVANEFQSRLAARVAVIGTTAKLINEYLGFPMDADKIQELTVGACSLDVVTDLAEKSYGEILSKLVQMQQELVLKSSNERMFRDTKGYLVYDRKRKTLKIDVLETVMKDILISLGYESPTQVLKRLKSKDYIETDGDRLTKRTMFEGQRIKFITIVIPDNQQDLFAAINDIKLRNIDSERTQSNISNSSENILKEFSQKASTSNDFDDSSWGEENNDNAQ